MPSNPEVTAERHAALKNILARHPVASQDELCALLRKRGFQVTQSSVSRDLRDLGAAKVAGRYVLRETLAAATPSPSAYSEVAPWILRIRCAGPNLLVIHTPAGRASAVALTLDEFKWREVVGTIAGDDTVFVATAHRNAQAKLEAKLHDLGDSHA